MFMQNDGGYPCAANFNLEFESLRKSFITTSSADPYPQAPLCVNLFRVAMRHRPAHQLRRPSPGARAHFLSWSAFGRAFLGSLSLRQLLELSALPRCQTKIVSRQRSSLSVR